MTGGRTRLDAGGHGECTLVGHSNDEEARGKGDGGEWDDVWTRGEPHSWYSDGGCVVGLTGGGVRDLRLTVVSLDSGLFWLGASGANTATSKALPREKSGSYV